MTPFALSWVPVPHRNIVLGLMYEDVLLRRYQDAVRDLVKAPPERRALVRAEADKIKRDMKTVLN